MVNNYDQPEIILVNTQIPENLGFVARCMLNCKLKKLRVVNPNFSLLNEKILPLSAGASEVIDSIKNFDNLEDAIKDFNFLIACTARKRAFENITCDPEVAIKETKIKITCSNKVGFIFGPESSGLSNKHLSMVDRILTINSNLEFPSINLSHCVMIVCYEWLKLNNKKRIGISEKKKSMVKKEKLLFFYNYLEESLRVRGFMKTKPRETAIINKIRSIFNRIDLTENEVDTLTGIISSLSRKKIK